MPQVQVIQPIQQQPKRLRVAAYARVSSKSADQLNSMSVQVEYYTDLIQKNPNWEFVNSTPFVRQYDILFNKWGVLLCQKEYQTNDIRRNSREWL